MNIKEKTVFTGCFFFLDSFVIKRNKAKKSPFFWRIIAVSLKIAYNQERNINLLGGSKWHKKLFELVMNSLHLVNC